MTNCTSREVCRFDGSPALGSTRRKRLPPTLEIFLSHPFFIARHIVIFCVCRGVIAFSARASISPANCAVRIPMALRWLCSVLAARLRLQLCIPRQRTPPCCTFSVASYCCIHIPRIYFRRRCRSVVSAEAAAVCGPLLNSTRWRSVTCFVVAPAVAEAEYVSEESVTRGGQYQVLAEPRLTSVHMSPGCVSTGSWRNSHGIDIRHERRCRKKGANRANKDVNTPTTSLPPARLVSCQYFSRDCSLPPTPNWQQLQRTTAHSRHVAEHAVGHRHAQRRLTGGFTIDVDNDDDERNERASGSRGTLKCYERSSRRLHGGATAVGLSLIMFRFMSRARTCRRGVRASRLRATWVAEANSQCIATVPIE